MALKIQVEKDSLAYNSGLRTDEKIFKINGKDINDQIDFSFYSSDEYLFIKTESIEGKIKYTEIERIYNEHLGISVFPPEIEQCSNKCVFCFVHQQHRGMRKSLYVRDDDYRFSFSDGNFVTLTNLKPHDWKRIYSLNLSPLYVSIHSTEPDLREKMLRNPKARKIKEQLRNLSKHNIEFHTQIVLCPDYNDNEHLDKTIKDLIKFYPNLIGIGIVPSGLTQFRKHLPYIKSWDKELAIKAIEQVEKWQRKFQKEYNKTIVYLADEFYYLSGKPLPSSKHYDEFYFLEDGIGTTSYFYKYFNKYQKSLPKTIESKREVSIVCGVIAEKYLEKAINKMNEIENLKVNLIPVENEFYGKEINVTGLLTGQDIIKTLKNKKLGEYVIIPSVTLRAGETVFLDDYTVQDVKESLKVSVIVSEMGANNFINSCLGFNLV